MKGASQGWCSGSSRRGAMSRRLLSCPRARLPTCLRRRTLQPHLQRCSLAGLAGRPRLRRLARFFPLPRRSVLRAWRTLLRPGRPGSLAGPALQSSSRSLHRLRGMQRLGSRVGALGRARARNRRRSRPLFPRPTSHSARPRWSFRSCRISGGSLTAECCLPRGAPGRDTCGHNFDSLVGRPSACQT